MHIYSNSLYKSMARLLMTAYSADRWLSSMTLIPQPQSKSWSLACSRTWKNKRKKYASKKTKKNVTFEFSYAFLPVWEFWPVRRRNWPTVWKTVPYLPKTVERETIYLKNLKKKKNLINKNNLYAIETESIYLRKMRVDWYVTDKCARLRERRPNERRITGWKRKSRESRYSDSTARSSYNVHSVCLPHPLQNARESFAVVVVVARTVNDQ